MPNDNTENKSRREFLSASAAAGIILGTGLATGREVHAQDTFSTPGSLPESTPITDLGLNNAEIKLLTKTARSLIKGDLEDLFAFERNRSGKPNDTLTVADVHSIREAFHERQLRLTALANRASTNAASRGLDGFTRESSVEACCCCTPCCSCAATQTRVDRYA